MFHWFQKGVDVNKPDFYGLTALQYAGEFGNVHIVKLLIKQGKIVR